MKEDTQLIVPIGYEDPFEIWPSIKDELGSLMPLEDVSCMSQISGSSVSIPSLPLRFMPANANLFKDTDHPFRWFLAPYVHLYILRAESLEAYKALKPALKQWVDLSNSNSSGGKKPWLILFVPVGTPKLMDTYTKVYAKLSSDFYGEKSGDRSVFVLLKNEFKSTSQPLPPQFSQSFKELCSKLRVGVIASFQQRTLAYDADIRRLDSYRGTVQLDFRQLFLVKESLALMYQMMQLPNEALLQYEELEALLAFSPEGQLPDSEWPMVVSESSKSSSKHQQQQQQPPPTLQPDATATEAAVISNLVKEKDCWSDPTRQGEEVLLYSINVSRMRILKNRIAINELQRYIFARQIYFLTLLGKPLTCAYKSLTFVKTCHESIARRIANLETSARGTQDWETQQHAFTLRKRQAAIWAICAAAKLTRVCREIEESDAQSGTVAGIGSALPLGELLMFALILLQSLTSVVKHCRVSSMSMASEYTSWAEFDSADKPHLASDLDTSTSMREGDLDANTDEYFATFSQRLRAMAQFIFPQSMVAQHHSPSISPIEHSELAAVDEEATPPKAAAAAVVFPKPPRSGLPHDASVAVLLIRNLIKFEALAARNRLVLLGKLQIADIYICLGAYRSSLRLYKEVLSGISSAGQVFPNAQSSTAPAPKDSPTFQRGCLLQTEHWANLRFSILRKILVCARAVSDVTTYGHALLYLLEPQNVTIGLISPSQRAPLLGDLLSLANCKLPSPINHALDGSGNYASPSSRLLIERAVLPIQPYFQTSIVFGATSLPSPSNRVLRETISVKLIQDEAVAVKLAKCEGGKEMSLRIQISSLFPGSVYVESVRVVYCAYSLLQASSIGDTPLSAAGNGNGQLEFDKNHMFECMLSLPRDQGSVCILPGEQFFDLAFHAPCTGEFHLMQTSITMGSLIFDETFVCESVGDLHKLCRSHTVLCVEQPQDLLALQAEAASFTPLEPDEVIVRFRTEEQDQLTGLRVWTLAGKYAISDASISETNILVPTKVPGQSDYLGTIVETTGVEDFSLKFQPPRQSAPALDAQSCLITIDKASLWSVSSKIAVNALPKNEPNGVEHLFFPLVRGQVDFNLRVPFSPNLKLISSRGFDDEQSAEHVPILVVMQGVLLRNGCAIAFDVRAECMVRVGEAIMVSHHTYGLFDGEFFLQAVLRNVSPVPLKLVSSTLISSEEKSGESAMRLVEGQEVFTRASATGLVLFPNQELHAAFRILSSPSTVASLAPSNRSKDAKGQGGVYLRFGFHRLEEANNWEKDRQFSVKTAFLNKRSEGGINALLHLSARIQETIEDSGHDKQHVWGSPVVVIFTLNVELPPSQHDEQSSNTTVIVSPIETLHWAPVGWGKQSLSATHFDEASLTFCFRVLYVPLVVGKFDLPPISVCLNKNKTDDTTVLFPSSSSLTTELFDVPNTEISLLTSS